MVYAVQIQRRERGKLIITAQHPHYILAEAIPGCIYCKCNHRAKNRGKYGDGLYHSMIDDKDDHIPSPLIMFTCTALRHVILEWQKNKGIHSKASNSKLKADIPDRSHYFNHNNDCGQDTSCCTATSRKLLTLPGVADTSTFFMNTWNTLPES